jgi:hypothetical protein
MPEQSNAAHGQVRQPPSVTRDALPPASIKQGTPDATNEADCAPRRADQQRLNEFSAEGQVKRPLMLPSTEIRAALERCASSRPPRIERRA